MFLFDEIVYRPIYNVLIFIYNILPIQDFGVAIIIVTVLLKFLLVPLSKKQIESQKKMQELQPKIKQIQEKYKNNKEQQSKALMAFYKEQKANPFSGCFPLIAQLVFFFAIYRVLFNISQDGLTVGKEVLYGFVADPGQINHLFFGLIDLAAKIDLKNVTLMQAPQILLVVGAALAQYFQTKMMMAGQPARTAKEGESDFTQMMSKQMLYLGPLLTLFIGIQFPAGLALYWLVSTLFMLGQQYLVEKETKEKAIT